MSCDCSSGSSYDGGIYGGVCNTDTPYPSVSHESVPSLIDNLVYALYGAITKDVTSGKVVWNIPCDPVTAPATVFNLPRNEGEGLLCYFIRAFNAANNGGSTFYGSFVGPLTGNVTGNLTGNVTGNVVGNVTGNITGNSGTATILQTARTIAISGDVTGTATSFNGSSNISIASAITADSIVNNDINAAAGIVDTKLATISTALKVSNSATTAASANSANSIVLRDASGNFSTGAITGSLIGNSTSATNLAGGLLNSIPYQTAANATAFLPAGVNGQVLGILAGALRWVSAPAASTATAITGGAAGQVPWQSNVNTTGFTAAGTTGQVLISNGTAAPTWSTNIGGNAATATTASAIIDGAVSTTGKIANTIVTPAKLSTGAPTWNTSGNVGIGTSSPSEKLDVNGMAAINSAGYGFLRLGAADSNGFAITKESSDNSFNVWAGGVQGSPVANRLSINSSGNVGIGTSSPSEKLEVSATAANWALSAYSSAGTTNKLIVGVASSGDGYIVHRDPKSLILGSNNTNRLTIAPDGNVGIGTSSPTEKLDVAGNVKATSFVGPLTGTASAIADGSVSTTAKIANGVVTAAKLGTNEQKQICKAWVNFNGTGTPVIRSSYNVSSVTKSANGFYGINFATPMADALYTVSSSSSRTNTGSAILVVNSSAPVPQGTTAVFVGNLNATTGGGIDESIISVQVFGN